MKFKAHPAKLASHVRYEGYSEGSDPPRSSHYQKCRIDTRQRGRRGRHVLRSGKQTFTVRVPDKKAAQNVAAVFNAHIGRTVLAVQDAEIPNLSATAERMFESDPESPKIEPTDVAVYGGKLLAKLFAAAHLDPITATAASNFIDSVFNTPTSDENWKRWKIRYSCLKKRSDFALT